MILACLLQLLWLASLCVLLPVVPGNAQRLCADNDTMASPMAMRAPSNATPAVDAIRRSGPLHLAQRRPAESTTLHRSPTQCGFPPGISLHANASAKHAARMFNDPMCNASVDVTHDLVGPSAYDRSRGLDQVPSQIWNPQPPA